MPMLDFRVRSTSRFGSVDIGGASSVSSAIRSAASGSRPSSRYLSRQASKTSSSSQDNHRRVVRQAVVCAGSLHVRTFKLLWKPAVLQLMVTTTTSLSEDESHFDDCDDDSDDSDDSDVEKLTTMARPNKTHHYSLVFCYRSLMGHARRERIELNDPRDPVELVWGEDGLLSTRFEFSVVYGSVGPSGRRRNLTCRARDAKDYLQWTEALRTALECQGENKDIKMNRFTHAHTVSSSKAPSNSRGSIGSFFDLDVVEEQQLLLEREAARKGSAHTPTSPTAATAAEAIAPPAADIARASALNPVPADIAAEYGGVRRRPVSIVVPAPRPVGTRLQRRKPSVPPMGTGKPLSIAPLRRGSFISKSAKPTATLPPFGRPHGARVDNATTEMSMSLPPPGGQRRRRTSSAARRLSSSSLRTRARKISISNGAHADSQANGAWRSHTPDTNSGSKRSRLRVSPTSQPEEKRPRVPSSPLTSAPVLGALPILQSPSSLTDSPLDFIDERPSIDNPRTTEFVNSLVKIAGVASAKQRQKLLQRQRQESCPVSTNYGLPLISRKSEEKEDPWLISRRSSRLNLDICDVEDEKSTRSNRRAVDYIGDLV
ncbi:hypothetical protein PF005_g10530 [Phytophthora fragariae]|uniref:PH domain-containing protein n=1 Tax=Phytophthora fragariae TaxID=53985 RepID=A0A6A3SA23_9STRA|nr:hypothetical protein PF003_g29493 [Phytophthora fragariae]KAE8938451.1 hypothetical protein PF009_g11662 [Phytophthora fragariae]KAE9010890.1 hypothetical protein PF011_g9624 [Phytophthora fragariae]KAE9112826.1 hypothetical protein PF007_g10952 [Phytophthora fragariae]KAE9113110.1 hypothetical protein PF010_g10198 [Phytophthora fragariae]